MNTTSETIALGTLTVDDILAHAPAIPFGEVVGTDDVQSFDPTDWPNLTVVGEAGLGKTNVIEVLAAAARMQGAVVYSVGIEDAERFDQSAFGLEPAETLIQQVHAEIRERLAPAHTAGGLSVEDLAYEHRPPHLILIVDDLSTMTLTDAAPEGTDEVARDTEYRGYLAHSIDKFASVGHLARIHLIVTVADLVSISEPLRRTSATLDLTSTAAADTGAAHFAVGRGMYSAGQDEPVNVQIFSAPEAPAL